MTFINTENNKCALLIGINYRGNREAKLDGCINDCNRLQDFLKTKCNYSNKNIEMITEDERVKPTKQNILNSLKNLVKRVKETNAKEVWFSYSGHGTFTNDYDSVENDKQDEVLVPLDYKREGYISDNTIYNILVKQLPTDCNLFIVIDACHSGTICDLPYQYQIKKGFIQEKNLENLPNVIKLGGCKDNQTSADAYIDGRYQGALTAGLLKSMEVLKYSFTAKELIAQCELYLSSNEYTQIPVLSLSNKNLINETILGLSKTCNISVSLVGDKYCNEENTWNILSLTTNKVLFPKDKQFYSKNEKINSRLNLKKGAYILFLKDRYGDGGVTGNINCLKTNKIIKSIEFNDTTYKVIDFEVL